MHSSDFASSATAGRARLTYIHPPLSLSPSYPDARTWRSPDHRFCMLPNVSTSLLPLMLITGPSTGGYILRSSPDLTCPPSLPAVACPTHTKPSSTPSSPAVTIHPSSYPNSSPSTTYTPPFGWCNVEAALSSQDHLLFNSYPAPNSLGGI